MFLDTPDSLMTWLTHVHPSLRPFVLISGSSCSTRTANNSYMSKFFAVVAVFDRQFLSSWLFFPHLWQRTECWRERGTFVTVCNCSEPISFKVLVDFAADSMANTICVAFLRVNSFSANRLLWVGLLFSSQMNLSLIVSSRTDSSNKQWAAILLNSAQNSATVSPSACICRWKWNLSEITKSAGSKKLTSSIFSCA